MYIRVSLLLYLYDTYNVPRTSYLNVSTRKWTSLFIHVHYIWIYASFFSYVYHTFTCTKNFIFKRLYSYMNISFHTWTSRFISKRLYSYMNISFHKWTSLFIHEHLFSHMNISFHISFHTWTCHMYDTYNIREATRQ